MPTNPKPRGRGLSHRQHLTLGLAAFAVLAGVAVLADYMAWQKASPIDPVPGPLQEDDEAAARSADAPAGDADPDRPPQEAFGNATLISGGSPAAPPAP